MSLRTYILALTASEAQAYAHLHGLPSRTYTILTDPKQLLGTYNPRVLCIGQYPQHPRYIDFLFLFQRLDAHVTDETGETVPVATQ